MSRIGIHWFRRDLRIHGNPGLRWNYKQTKGNTLGVFCFDSKFLSRSDFSHNRFAVFMNAINQLKINLKNIGMDLVVIDELPNIAYPKILSFLKDKNITLEAFSYNRDYEPFALKRDNEINTWLTNENISFQTFRDHLIIEPHELAKPDGTFYKVYTPFAKKWLEIFTQTEVKKRCSPKFSGINQAFSSQPVEKIFHPLLKSKLKNFPYQDYLQSFIDDNSKKVTIEIPTITTESIYQNLKNFKSKISKYKVDRDYPNINGTSKFSIPLKNGSLTTSQVISYLKLKPVDYKSPTGEMTFLKEIIWREFYYHILFHQPSVETTAFKEKYRNLKWCTSKKLFSAWCEGKTGFPIVDAGMRELNTTGWMHNRVRMIVASFLVKNLQINWQWGEKYFMEKLLDGDLAPNNGGWQWAASTGCDAQPYFRIFNPWTQSKKFDSNGEYIKKYIPELATLDNKQIHEPHLFPGKLNYPKPIIDYKKSREETMERFKIL